MLAEQRGRFCPRRGLDQAKARQSQHLLVRRRPGSLALARIGRGGETAHGTTAIALAVAKAIGPDAILRRAALVALAERVEDLVGCARRLIDAHADGVVHRVRDRRDDRVERTFAGLFRPEWTLAVVGLDDDRLELRRVERGRQLVIEK